MCWKEQPRPWSSLPWGQDWVSQHHTQRCRTESVKQHDVYLGVSSHGPSTAFQTESDKHHTQRDAEQRVWNSMMSTLWGAAMALAQPFRLSLTNTTHKDTQNKECETAWCVPWGEQPWPQRSLRRHCREVAPGAPCTAATRALSAGSHTLLLSHLQTPSMHAMVSTEQIIGWDKRKNNALQKLAVPARQLPS